MVTPANTGNDLDVFARVVDGQIVEYPVFRLHIKNRAHPLDWYTPVVESPKPELPPFSNYKTKLSIVGGTVLVTYSVVKQTLDEILRNLAVDDTAEPGLPGLNPGKVPPKIEDVSPETIAPVYDMVGEHVMAKLDTWAATRKYTTFNTLINYRDSAIQKFKLEALRGIELRDATWAALANYFSSVSTGQLPVPISIQEIDALMPPLLWPDEVTPPEQPTTPVVDPTTPPAVHAVHAPTILFPTEGSTVGTSCTVVLTGFVSDSADDSFSQLRWEASRDPEFKENVMAGFESNAQSFELTTLQPDSTYYVRAAHVGAILGASVWSTTTRFSVPAPVQEAPAA